MGVIAGRDESCVPCWNGGPHLERGLKATPSPGSGCQSSIYYLVDNVFCSRLSAFDRAVNDKAGCGNEGSGNGRRRMFLDPGSIGRITSAASAPTFAQNAKVGHPSIWWEEKNHRRRGVLLRFDIRRARCFGRAGGAQGLKPRVPDRIRPAEPGPFPRLCC